MGLLFKVLGKTPSAGLPYTRNGVLPFNGIPTACPFWVGDPLARSGGRSRARDIEIVGNTISLASRGPLWLRRASPPINCFPQDVHPWEFLFFSHHTAPPGLAGRPLPQIASRRMLICGKLLPPLPDDLPGGPLTTSYMYYFIFSYIIINLMALLKCVTEKMFEIKSEENATV